MTAFFIGLLKKYGGILNNNEFIKKAVETHGDKYDYILTDIKKGSPKVYIICKIHGKFEQRIYDHIKGNGCDKCSKTYKLTTESFIEKSKKVHGEKYNYSLVDYKSNKIKVIIICAIHGKFNQSPNSHLLGSGCDYCGGTAKLNTNEFINMCKKIHKDKYDYSSVAYEKNNIKVTIICKIHGLFKQTPNRHLQGDGCKQCANTNKSFTIEEFILKSTEAHGDKYDYSLVNYKNCRNKVDIICKKHGKFSQKVMTHLQGKGCKKCSNSISKKETKWLDSLNINNEYRNLLLKINNKLYSFDAYDSNINTIYEFYGDYWHGNPKKFKSSDINKNNKKTFGELYQKTIDRENELKALGYNVISIWESDWNNIL